MSNENVVSSICYWVAFPALSVIAAGGPLLHAMPPLPLFQKKAAWRPEVLLLIPSLQLGNCDEDPFSREKGFFCSRLFLSDHSNDTLNVQGKIPIPVPQQNEDFLDAVPVQRQIWC